MEVTIQTKSYRDALQWALDQGFTLAEVFGITSEIKELLDDEMAAATVGEADEHNDWIIVGDLLCRAGNIWDGSESASEVYALL